jgi:hypothetical protein
MSNDGDYRMSSDYRVIKHKHHSGFTRVEYTFSVGRVYYDKNGLPSGYALDNENTLDLEESTIEELQLSTNNLKKELDKAFEKPILDTNMGEL